MSTPRSSPAPLEKAALVVGIIAGLAIPALTFVATYGALAERVTLLEKRADQTVTRTELQAVSGRLDELVSEVRGLRSDLITVIKDRR